MRKWVHVIVLTLFAVLIVGALIGILTAAAKGIFWSALLFLVGIGAMIYFATDGFKREDE